MGSSMKSALIHTFERVCKWRMFPIAGCNPVGITSRVAPSGSIPSSSTKNLLSESKHGVGASLLTKNELGSIPSRTAS